MDFAILGPLEIRQNGRALPCRGAKQRLLLAALLLHANEVVSSDRLVEALWGEQPPATAAKALQMHVSQLRRLLEPDVIRTRPPGYELHVGPGELDLQVFESLVADARAQDDPREAGARLAEALALWRGAPLADLSYEEALQPEIARLEELRLAVTEERIDADLALGRHQELVGELEALAAANPLRERVHGQLMLALYRSGRQAEALEVFADARRRLVDELGLEPSRELKGLQQQILAQDARLEIRPAPARQAGDEGLLGREDEFASLSAVIDRAVSGRAAIVLIGGEPGIGKSRLAEALARHADSTGARVAVGRCWEAGGAPAFWPWIQALRTVLHDSELGALTDLGGEDDASPSARFRMFSSIAALLRGAAAETPVALFLDDLHAADEPSLLLLRFVAAELAQSPVAVVGCYRDSEVGPELAGVIADLSREPVAARVALQGLDITATRRLLEATMGGEPPGRLVERVHTETRGNPLFAGELGRLFASEGLPAGPDARLPIPEGVREAVHRRVQRLSERCQAVLAFASVVGREFDTALLAQLTGTSVADLANALDEAIAARLVGETPGASGQLRFSHILVRDALYGDIPAARRMQLHGDIAGALAAMHAANAGPHLAEIAHHYLEAGPAAATPAIEYARLAGDHAQSQHGYEAAADYYRAALALLDKQHEEAPAARCDVLLSLGEALSRAGASAAAKDALREAAVLAESHDWPERLARAAVAYGGRFAWARGSTDPFLRPLLERALAATGDRDPRIRARLLARLAAAMRDDPGRDQRAAIANEAVEIARRSDDLVTRAYALEGAWVALEEAGSLAEGIAVSDELIELGARIGDPEHEFTGRDFRLNAFWKLTDRAGVDVELDVLTTLAEQLRQPAWRWWVRTTRTALTLMEGRFDEAEQLIRETRSFGEEAERWNAHVSERLQLFVLRRAQGRLPELADLIARSVHEYPSLLRFPAAQANLLAEVGDQRGARNVLASVLERDLAREHVDAEWLFTIALLPDPCRFLADEDAAATLYPLLLPHAGAYAQAPVEASFGSAARALGVLATVLGSFDDAERHFEAALEIERRMRARPWVAHVQHDYGALLAVKHDLDGAAALLAQAQAGYEALGMDSWAERARALAG